MIYTRYRDASGFGFFCLLCGGILNIYSLFLGFLFLYHRMKTIIITSGYFNPIHPGHIECFELCKELGDELRVIVNNDVQAKLKTKSEDLFQDQEYRIKVVSAMKMVDRVMLSVDADGSVCASICAIVEKIKKEYGPDTKIIFGK